MPKLPLLILAAALAMAVAAEAAPPTNAHFDPTRFPKPCTACHRGHGMVGGSKMRGGTNDLCLTCHESAAKNPIRKAAVGLGAAASPQDIRSEFLKPSAHGRAACADCHSAHAQSVVLVAGFRNLSPSRSFRFESDLCLSCHGSRGAQGADPRDLAKLFLVTNPSFHPVLASGRAASVPSLLAPYAPSSLMNCTDCHTNDDPSGPRGPHGSRVLKVLGRSYWLTDGQPESATTYALCYACHDRTSLLSDASFKEHKKHVAGEKTSCATCHNPHGATSARALIRFNEAFPTSGVAPSSSGRLEFISTSAGSGSCYLTCHGKNHNPLGYGSVALRGVSAAGKSAPLPGGRRAVVPAPAQAPPMKR